MITNSKSIQRLRDIQAQALLYSFQDLIQGIGKFWSPFKAVRFSYTKKGPGRKHQMKTKKQLRALAEERAIALKQAGIVDG